MVTDNDEPIIVGRSASPGRVEGEVIFITDEDGLENVNDTHIIVTKMTDMNMLAAMRLAAGVVTAEGGMLCHAAIQSREFKKPCVVGAGEDVWIKLTPKQRITIDGSTGKIYA